MRIADIVLKLHEAADSNLFGGGAWPATAEFTEVYLTSLVDMGLEEGARAYGYPGATQNTALGREVNVNLMAVFAGVFNVWDIPEILESHGYLERKKVMSVLELSSEAEATRRVHRYVIRAYLKFCNRSHLLN